MLPSVGRETANTRTDTRTDSDTITKNNRDTVKSPYLLTVLRYCIYSTSGDPTPRPGLRGPGGLGCWHSSSCDCFKPSSAYVHHMQNWHCAWPACLRTLSRLIRSNAKVNIAHEHIGHRPSPLVRSATFMHAVAKRILRRACPSKGMTRTRCVPRGGTRVLRGDGRSASALLSVAVERVQRLLFARASSAIGGADDVFERGDHLVHLGPQHVVVFPAALQQ